MLGSRCWWDIPAPKNARVSGAERCAAGMVSGRLGLRSLGWWSRCQGSVPCSSLRHISGASRSHGSSWGRRIISPRDSQILATRIRLFFFFFSLQTRPDMTFTVDWALNNNYLSISLQVFVPRSSIGGVAYVTVLIPPPHWAATFLLRRYKCMLVISVCRVIHQT